MAYTAPYSTETLKKEANGEKYFGESRHCVAAVKHFCRAPQTSLWRKGLHVKNNQGIRAGTAIATFDSPNDGYRGHAAIYLGQNSSGLQVLDQWVGQPFHLRTIYFGRPKVSNDGNKFYVID